MTNFTTNTYEMKRKIVNFSEKISNSLDKSTKKVVMDMEYGLAKSQSVLLSEISRTLDEKIKIKNTIERLSDNLNLLLTAHMGHLGLIAEKLDSNLLTIKIIEAAKALRNKVFVWYSQLAKGVSEILKYAHNGIKEYQKIEKRLPYKQLQLQLNL